MARTWPIIRALARVTLREQHRWDGIRANNLFWVLFLLGQGAAGGFVFLLVGLVALFPLCSDPFRRLPGDRVATWPVTAHDLRVVRLSSAFLSPAAWIGIGVIVWTGRPQFLLLAFLLVAFALPFPHSVAFRFVPGFFGELVRKNVRELLSLLDPYIALLLSGSTMMYRILRPAIDRDALLIMCLVVVVSLSTCAQSLFALDAGPGLDRYRLLPIRGWRILAAKHAALMLVALPLTLPLHPLAALTALSVALGMGNYMAVTNPKLQTRWSLSAGALLPGLFQSAALVAAGLHAARETPWMLPVAVLFYLASTLLYGWRLDRRLHR